ncbi:kelch repeat-containing protein [Patulibacter sp. SYSU D01012]|uniref:Kelch repeat-containing protein n=1 Tax=Patulibacter sp. SYSU D01012 TaxID=2817381 RepID=UPI001B314598|nr:kelch repeat-containing protein [Patulibacter sp. SYSU D01012]
MRRPAARPALVAGAVALALGATAPTIASAASGWAPTGSMAAGRSAAAAVRLADGRILVASGFSGTGEVPSAELYDPARGTWSPAGTLGAGRHYAAAALLPDGRVLLTGGFTAAGATATTELYDPATNAWTPGPPMHRPRSGQVAVALGDGRILVAGGSDFLQPAEATSEIYDPATGTWSAPVPMGAGRENARAALLPDGRVLVAGGADQGGGSTTFAASAETYDPRLGVWAPTAAMTDARSQAGSAVLRDGRVVVVGGVNRSGLVGRAEAYAPASGTWQVMGPALLTGNTTAATTLADDRVLVQTDATATTPLLDPTTGAVTGEYALDVPRVQPTLTPLADGRILVAGGTVANGVRSPTAQLFTPRTRRTATGGDAGAVRAGAAAERDVVVRNDGPERLWTTGVAVEGADAGDFTVVREDCTDGPVTAGDDCVVRVRFAPTATGPRTARLALDDNAETSAAPALTGTGEQAPPAEEEQPQPTPQDPAPRPAAPVPAPVPPALTPPAATSAAPTLRIRGIRATDGGTRIRLRVETSAARVAAVATHTEPGRADVRAPQGLLPGPGRIAVARAGARPLTAGTHELVLARTAVGRRARFALRTVRLRVVVTATGADGQVTRRVGAVRARVRLPR